MKKNYSNIFTFNRKTLSKTINCLKNGSVAGLPTETVYGLGGNAYKKSSIKKIFNLKRRPKSNPLIIHYYHLSDAVKDVEINEYFIKLYKKFCPGPITFILKKKKYSKIHPFASAKLKTIAIRFPKHRFIRSILKKIDFPLAMPSANKSTNVSPVRAEIDKILSKLENQETDLDESISDYHRLILLNKHIDEMFKKKFKQISEKVKNDY